MSTVPRVTALVLAALLLVACTGRSGAVWTSPPDRTNVPDQAPTAAPAATATPGAVVGSPQPTGAPGVVSDSVIPALTPKAQLQTTPAGEVNTSYAPDVPPAVTRTEQAIVEVAFDIVEGVKAINPNGLQYETWGYRLHGDTTVTTGTPGPMIRARVGDVVRFSLTNLPTNKSPHNIDFHAVTGQGGGAADLTVAPGETAVIEARMLYPGLFMYHCAAGDVPLHISQGMYGGILVDPEQPLPAVEHELYMVQSEFYTGDPVDGVVTTDRAAITDEHPSYVVFNGAVGSLTGDNAPRIQIGDTMRIYFVNAGLNLDSNFHPIGSHWDKVYEEGTLLSEPLRGSQTTLVPAGGSTIVELIGQVPATIVLVDHALARAFDKGAIGQIVVTGDPNPEIFEALGKTGTPAPPPTATPAGSQPPASAEPSGSPAPEPSGTAAPGGDQQVSIVAGAFNFQAENAPDEFADTEAPADYSVNVLMIPVGTTVTWSNDDPGMMHTVTAVDGSFDSGMFGEGETFSHTFDAPGEFEYFCTPHPWMRARVVVMMH